MHSMTSATVRMERKAFFCDNAMRLGTKSVRARAGG